MQQRDGYVQTGCLNMGCPGFVQAKGATIAPGALIHPVSNGSDTQLQNVTIQVSKVSVASFLSFY
jgi:hypothetical protein